MKIVLFFIGTRPEAIKLAPVILRMKSRPDQFKVIVCATAQHREMLDQVLQLFEISPDIDLDLMMPNQSLPSFTARSLLTVTDVIKKVEPQIVLVQGDTTTAMVSTLASFYEHIPVGHVEAGLRTGNPYSPFPEEMNRRLISVLARFHFAPTKRAEKLLLSEGIPKENVWHTGNTVVDALKLILARSEIPDLGIENDRRKIILVTAHRRESFGQPLENMCEALKKLAARNPDVHIIYPVHPNPRVQDPVRQILSGKDNISLLEPLGYLPFVSLMNACHFILTDSGGIQEEAPALGKPVLVMRDETERVEAIEAGTSKLIGTRTETILVEAETLLQDPNAYHRMATAISPFGDGSAAEKIIDLLVHA